MKKFLPAITVFTLLALAAGILWYQKVYMPSHEQNAVAQRMGESVANTQNMSRDNTVIGAADIDTSNWKEYCNEEYGFCVKYPEGWEVRETREGPYAFDFSVSFVNEMAPCDIFDFRISVYTQRGMSILQQYPPYYGNDTPRKLVETIKVSSSLKSDISVKRLIYNDRGLFEDFAEIQHGTYTLHIHGKVWPNCQKSAEEHFIAMLQSMSPAH